MIIKHGMVLAAGLGKRMRPLTLKIPKPLLLINNISLMERAINLLIEHGVQEISINVHYLSDQIQSFLKKKKFQANINISSEIDILLDTGGGVLKGTKQFKDNPFFVINPDTVWNKNYLEEIKILEKNYFKNKNPTLLVVNKNLSIDSSFGGDFNLKDEKILRGKENQFVFTGLHITRRDILEREKSKIFSMNKIWNDLIKVENLNGVESKQKFYHLNSFEMYKKIVSLKIID